MLRSFRAFSGQRLCSLLNEALVGKSLFCQLSMKRSFVSLSPGAFSRKGAVAPLAKHSATPTSRRAFGSKQEPSSVVLDTWKTADSVCFDVDSTVITVEGIDVLADFLGVGEKCFYYKIGNTSKVATLTREAMEGGMLFHEALAARLDIMRPSHASILSCLKTHPHEFTPGVEELIKSLHAKNVKVFLVSGGFRQMINPIADHLNIPRERIYANNLLFNETDGKYIGFDPDEPTSRAGGKPVAIKSILKEHGLERLIMIGDGATDMEAKPPASAFIGFGGVVTRPVVAKNADWFVTDFSDLIDQL